MEMEMTMEDVRELGRRPGHRSAAERLTDDLLVEILSRLPVKSLLRFSCVSRSWYAIVSTDNFYRRNKLPPRMYGLFYFSNRPGTDPEKNYEFSVVHPNCNTSSNIVVEDSTSTRLLPFLPPHDDLWVEDCCNGLVLCTCREPTSPLESSFFVCNPATKTWDRIPRGSNEDLYFIIALAFDPQVSPHHYKVVTITFTDDIHGADSSMEMEILSSETGEWVVYEDCKGEQHLRDFVAQADVHVFFNGNIHVAENDNLMVMAADIERGVYRKMELPHTTEGDVVKLCLAIAAGRLRCSRQTDDHHIVVWDLEDYDREEWSLRYRVNLLDVNLEKWPELRKLVDDDSSSTTSSSSSEIEDVCCGWSNVYMEALHPDLDVVFLTMDDKLICYHLIRRDIVDVHIMRGYSSTVFYTYSTCYTSHLKQV